jgi:hypothetical protein
VTRDEPFRGLSVRFLDLQTLGLYSLYHPPVFQGNLGRSNYFEGWYFKQVSADCSEVISVIPGVSLARNRHAFIQVINGISGDTHYIEFPLTEFSADKKRLAVNIGPNRFSEDGIELNINRRELQLNGRLGFTGTVPWPRRPWAPGIMGWYSFVPGMECYHGVVSLDHTISGTLEYNGSLLDFHHGRGYIEKDWGTSMPESWIWLHANTFRSAGTSVMLSVAKIPWRNNWFTGFIAFVLHDGRLYRFNTYNGSSITDFMLKGQDLKITLKSRNFSLSLSAHQKKAGKLKAPVKGLMERYIKESIDSDVEISLLKRNGSVVFEGEARRSGLELVGEPEKLLDRPVW